MIRDCGCDVNAANEHLGMTPILYACQEGWPQLAQELVLRFGADLRAVNRFGSTALALAARAGDLSLCSFIIDRAVCDINARNAGGRSALYLASAAGHEATVTLLALAGADANQAEPEFGLSPLHAAAERGHVGVLRALFQAFANVEAQDSLGRTAFFLAAEARQMNAMACLAKELHCNVDAPAATYGQNALSLAAGLGDVGLVRFLLRECSADPNATSPAPTAVSPAAANHRGAFSSTNNSGFGEKAPLVGQGGESSVGRAPSPPPPRGFSSLEANFSPLHSHSIASPPRSIARPGATALVLAVAGGHETVARILVSHGAHVDQPDASGATPLLLAVRAGDLHAAAALAAAGARWDVADASGETAAQAAAGMGKEEFLELMKQSAEGAASPKRVSSGWGLEHKKGGVSSPCKQQ